MTILSRTLTVIFRSVATAPHCARACATTGQARSVDVAPLVHKLQTWRVVLDPKASSYRFPSATSVLDIPLPLPSVTAKYGSISSFVVVEADKDGAMKVVETSSKFFPANFPKRR